MKRYLHSKAALKYAWINYSLMNNYSYTVLGNYNYNDVSRWLSNQWSLVSSAKPDKERSSGLAAFWCRIDRVYKS